MFLSPVKNIVTSGYAPTYVGVAGFFGASVCHLGAAAAVGSVASVAAPCFLGGMALYLPLVCVKKLLVSLSILEKKSHFLNNMVDVAFLLLAAPVGAYLLGQAMLPLLVCAAMGVLLCRVINCSMGAVFEKSDIDCGSRYKKQDIRSDDIVTASLGSFVI